MSAAARGCARRAVLLALCAGGIAASAPPCRPGGEWVADPDDQFLLDVNIRQLRLGDGVRAYNTPEGTCVVLGDFLTTLDVPMRIDLAAKKASGWAFKESNRIAIDYAANDGQLRRQSPSRWRRARSARRPKAGACRPSALTRWFGIGVKPVTVRLGADAPIRSQAAGRAGDRAAEARRSGSSRRSST